MTIDRDQGDAPRRLVLRELGTLAHALAWENPHICFATSSMDAAPGARAEDDDGPPSSEPASSKSPNSASAEDEDEGTEPNGKCENCGSANEDNAKFCDQCGKSLAAKPMGDEEDDDDEDDEDESAAAHPPPPERMQAPKSMSLDASTAAILRASSESPLAIKTAAIKARRVIDTVAGITGKTDPDEMIGALLAVPEKIARGVKAAEDLAGLKAKRDDAERKDLCHRLAKVAPHLRSKVLADVVTEGGARSGVRIRSKYLKMNLGVLRGLVTDLEGDAPKQRRNPFEPSEERAHEAAKTGQTGTREERIERAKKDPSVLRMFNRPGNNLSLDALAKSHVDNNFDLPGARA